MESVGICQLCGSIAQFSCKKCGALVCEKCYDKINSVCASCKAGQRL